MRGRARDGAVAAASGHRGSGPGTGEGPGRGQALARVTGPGRAAAVPGLGCDATEGAPRVLSLARSLARSGSGSRAAAALSSGPPWRPRRPLGLTDSGRGG
jgi:hypothetical protein